MTTLGQCSPHQVFGRQPPPGAGYKFRDLGGEGRQGWGLGISPYPFLGAVYVVGFLATVRGFVGCQGQGLGIPWLLLGCQGLCFLRVAFLCALLVRGAL